MQSKNRKILIGVILGAAMLAVALTAFILGRITSDDKAAVTATVTTSPTVSTAKTTATAATSPASNTTPAPQPASHGPYNSMGAAVAYVEAQSGGMAIIDPGTTWQPGSTLHVIHATPEGSASYGGDFYYFFVDGYQVGEYDFTSAQTAQTVNDTTFAVTFNVYMPTDPHCCPTGGVRTVQFQWDGANLVTSGSMTGATM